MAADGEGSDWPGALHRALKDAGVTRMSHVPDAGHARLIALCEDDPAMVTNVLTTEEEGIAIAAGAWLGGEASVLLLHSSALGTCTNILSLPPIGRFPLLMLVPMWGEWAEFNPWQVPMGRATQATLEAMGVTVQRADTADELVATVESAAALAFKADQQVAVLISQRLLGRKTW